MASEPEWTEIHGGGGFATMVGGCPLFVRTDEPHVWELDFQPITGNWNLKKLAATEAEAAKLEALDRVLEWTVKLSAEAGRLKGKTELEGDDA